LESKLEKVIEDDQFGHLTGKGRRDANELMRIVSERVLELRKRCVYAL
jgi:hypothetical protein